MIDPPWPKKKGGLRKVRPNQGRQLDYQTMTIEQIFTLLDKEIFPQAAATHNVFLWVTDSVLVEAEQQMKARGYKRHARIIWDKRNGVAPAFTIRYIHEYLIWFYKPKLIPVAVHERGKLTTIISEKAREHSRKPEASYEFIRKLYPESTYFDVFSREKRPGWAQFGDECEKFK